METGENHLRFSVFCGSEGLQVALLRKRRGKSPSPPDLFDQVELVLRKLRPPGFLLFANPAFLSKSELAASARSISGSLDLALLYLNNGRLLLEPQPLFNLLEIALLRLCEGGPSFGFFKALFLFAKNEGLPVKEAWLPGLAKSDQSIARSVLAHPVGTKSKVSAELVPLVESLRLWLNSETELRC